MKLSSALAGLLIVLLSVALAACGYNPGSSPAPQPPVQVTHTPVQVQKCGIVHSIGRLLVPTGDTGAQRAENCFWHAFQQCSPASLVFIMSGVDTVLTRTFTLHNENGKCSISDARQFRVVPQPPSAARTYTCIGLTQQKNGLHFSACGKDGDVVVPAA